MDLDLHSISNFFVGMIVYPFPNRGNFSQIKIQTIEGKKYLVPDHKLYTSITYTKDELVKFIQDNLILEAIDENYTFAIFECKVPSSPKMLVNIAHAVFSANGSFPYSDAYFEIVQRDNCNIVDKKLVLVKDSG